MELYAGGRRAVIVEGMSEREAAREFGLARETVRKMVRYSVPPGYQGPKPVRPPKLDQIGRDHRSDPGTGQAATAQAAPHRPADL